MFQTAAVEEKRKATETRAALESLRRSTVKQIDVAPPRAVPRRPRPQSSPMHRPGSPTRANPARPMSVATMRS